MMNMIDVEQIEEGICRVSSSTIEIESLRQILLRAYLDPKDKDDVLFSHMDASFAKEGKPVVSEFIVLGEKSEIQFHIDSAVKMQRPYPKK